MIRIVYHFLLQQSCAIAGNAMLACAGMPEMLCSAWLMIVCIKILWFPPNNQVSYLNRSFPWEGNNCSCNLEIRVLVCSGTYGWARAVLDDQTSEDKTDPWPFHAILWRMTNQWDKI